MKREREDKSRNYIYHTYDDLLGELNIKKENIKQFGYLLQDLAQSYCVDREKRITLTPNILKGIFFFEEPLQTKDDVTKYFVGFINYHLGDDEKSIYISLFCTKQRTETKIYGYKVFDDLKLMYPEVVRYELVSIPSSINFWEKQGFRFEEITDIGGKGILDLIILGRIYKKETDISYSDLWNLMWKAKLENMRDDDLTNQDDFKDYLHAELKTTIENVNLSCYTKTKTFESIKEFQVSKKKCNFGLLILWQIDLFQKNHEIRYMNADMV